MRNLLSIAILIMSLCVAGSAEESVTLPIPDFVTLTCGIHDMKGESSCNNDNACTWNKKSSACIAKCSVIEEQNDCLAEVAGSCRWVDKKCRVENYLSDDCHSSHKKEKSCEKASRCSWSTKGKGRCVVKCDAITAKETCKNESKRAGCRWKDEKCTPPAPAA